MANIERVKAVVENIEKQLARQKSQPVVTNLLSLNMEDWFVETKNAAGDVCGTAMCLAGWAAHTAGFKMYHRKDGEWSGTDVVVATGSDIAEFPTVEEWAAKFFEFTPDEAEIFYYTDVENVEQLKAALNYILEEEVFEGVAHYYDF